VNKLVELLTKVLAPTTVLGALLFYLGWVRTDHVLRSFGVDSSLVSFSVNDYIMRSADTTLEPLRWFLQAVLLVIVVHAALKCLVARHPSVAWKLELLAVGLGVVLAAVSEWARQHATAQSLGYSFGWTAGVGLAAYGLIYSPGVDRQVRSAQGLVTWVAAALFILGVFWTVETYAALRGDQLAQDLAEARASGKPCVTVYSHNALGIETPGIEAIELADPNGVYQYRYAGMRLLIRSDDKLFLLPSSWDGQMPTTIVLGDEDTLRVEFQPAGEGSPCSPINPTASAAPATE
jgi:hypothetical protein